MDPQTRRKIAEQDALDSEYSAATRRMLAGGRIEPIVWDRLGHNFRGSVKDSYRKARRRRAHYLFRLACAFVMLSSTAFTVDIRLRLLSEASSLVFDAGLRDGVVAIGVSALFCVVWLVEYFRTLVAVERLAPPGTASMLRWQAQEYQIRMEASLSCQAGELSQAPPAGDLEAL